MNFKRPVIDIDPKQKKGLSSEELSKLLKNWQKRLLLQDWNISLRIVDFQRKDYRQSGDFTADLEKKKAEILMTWDPWRGDEEYTLVHELIHLLLWDLDYFNENIILRNNKYSKENHDIYLGKLEEVVDKLTQVILEREEGQK